MFKILSVKSSYGPGSTSVGEIDDIYNTQFLCKTQKEKKLIGKNINDAIINSSDNLNINNVDNSIIGIFEKNCRQHNENGMRTYVTESGVNRRIKPRNRKTTKTIICTQSAVKNVFGKKKGRVK